MCTRLFTRRIIVFFRRTFPCQAPIAIWLHAACGVYRRLISLPWKGPSSSFFFLFFVFNGRYNLVQNPPSPLSSHLLMPSREEARYDHVAAHRVTAQATSTDQTLYIFCCDILFFADCEFNERWDGCVSLWPHQRRIESFLLFLYKGTAAIL